MKRLTKSSWVGHTGFVGMSLLCPPLPDKAMKLFFSTSPKTLPLRFNLTLVHRGQVFGLSGALVVPLAVVEVDFYLKGQIWQVMAFNGRRDEQLFHSVYMDTHIYTYLHTDLSP